MPSPVQPTSISDSLPHRLLRPLPAGGTLEQPSHAGQLHVLEYPYYLAKHGPQIALSRGGELPLRTSTVEPRALPCDTSPDYILLPFVLGLAATGLAVMRFGQQFAELLRGLLYGFITDRLANDTNALVARLLILLDVLMALFAGLLCVNTAHALASAPAQHTAELLIFVVGMALFCAYRAYAWLLHKGVAHVTQSPRLMEHLRFSGLLPLRLAPVVLLPLSLAAHYGHPSIAPYAYYAIVLIIALCILLRWGRMAMLFIRNDVPFLYFILYLCGLDLAPALIAIRLLISFANA